MTTVDPLAKALVLALAARAFGGDETYRGATIHVDTRDPRPGDGGYRVCIRWPNGCSTVVGAFPQIKALRSRDEALTWAREEIDRHLDGRPSQLAVYFGGRGPTLVCLD